MAAQKQEVRGTVGRAMPTALPPAAYSGAAPSAAVPVNALRGRLNRLANLVSLAEVIFDRTGSIRDRIVGASDKPPSGSEPLPAPNGLLEELDGMLSALDGLLDGTASRLQVVIENILD